MKRLQFGILGQTVAISQMSRRHRALAYWRGRQSPARSRALRYHNVCNQLYNIKRAYYRRSGHTPPHPAAGSSTAAQHRMHHRTTERRMRRSQTTGSQTTGGQTTRRQISRGVKHRKTSNNVKHCEPNKMISFLQDNPNTCR